MATGGLSVQGTAVTKSSGVSSLQNLLHPVVSAEDAWKLLEEKIRCRYKSVQHAFVRWDMDCDGEISDKEFRIALKNMGLDMTSKEYNKLWKKFDSSGDGKISYAEFNNKVGALIHPKSDLVLKRPETPRIKEWQKKAIARGLKKKMGNIEAAFKDVDIDGSGLISHQELIQLLRRLGMAKMSSEDSFSLMVKYRSKDNATGEMTFDEFKTCMMEYMKIPTDIDSMPADGPPPMPLVEAEKLISEKLFNKFSAVQRAFRLYDEDKSGELSYDELRRMFNTLNVPLKDEHFIALVKKYDPNGDGSISYEEFNSQLGPLIHPDAADSSRSMKELLVRGNAQDSLVFDPNARNAPVEEEEDIIGGAFEEQSPSHQNAGAGGSSDASSTTGNKFPSSASTAGSMGGSPSKSSVGGGQNNRGAAGGGGGAARAYRAGSIATSQFDVGATEEKMRRVLGRSWVAVYRDVKKTEGIDTADVAGENFRDMMAEKGVPLTAKEVRALSLKYNGNKGGQGSLNVGTLMKETFKGPLPMGTATAQVLSSMAHPSHHRPGTAGAVRSPGKAPAPSAFLRPSSAAPTNTLRAIAMSTKPVF